MRRTVTIAAAVAAVTLVTGAVPANAATPFQTFKDICEMAGGSASRDWGSGRLECRFPDGSLIWCTPTMRRCGLRRAAASAVDPGRMPWKVFPWSRVAA